LIEDLEARVQPIVPEPSAGAHSCLDLERGDRGRREADHHHDPRPTGKAESMHDTRKNIHLDPKKTERPFRRGQRHGQLRSLAGRPPWSTHRLHGPESPGGRRRIPPRSTTPLAPTPTQRSEGASTTRALSLRTRGPPSDRPPRSGAAPPTPARARHRGHSRDHSSRPSRTTASAQPRGTGADCRSPSRLRQTGCPRTPGASRAPGAGCRRWHPRESDE